MDMTEGITARFRTMAIFRPSILIARIAASALQTLVAMVAAGTMHTPVAQEFPIAEARAAYAEFVERPHRGRIVLTF